jgi:beta-phosphoglucomutase-like phosphatase (HAD superfamily)
VDAILFDWDGTLVDSLGAFHRANAIVMESFGLAFDVQF